MRLVIYTSASPDALHHLLWRLDADLPDVQIAGVLVETGRPPLSRARRLRRWLRFARQRDFLRYAAARVWRRGRAAIIACGDEILRRIHAAPRFPNGRVRTLEDVSTHWQARGVHFHFTADLHDAASLAFVRTCDADVGLIYATRILKPRLFAIPRQGSINIHKHKLPDYRGGGAPGLWEMLDGCGTQTVTVHRVVEEVDAGAILGEQTFRIDPLDTPESVCVKADLVGVDLIVDVLRQMERGQTVERAQPAGGRLYKGYQPHQVHAIECAIRRRRRRWRLQYTRSLAKRLARTAVLPLLAVRNHRNRRRCRFPVTILYHHLTSDRPKTMGIPTAVFAEHVRYLKKHYRIVALHDALRMLETGEVDAPTVVLTFDDGYAENYLGLRAVAELEDVPVTICVCTTHVADGSELAHDVERGERDFPSLTWEQVRYLDAHRMTIASHTRTHFDCGTDDSARLLAEIAGSQADLEQALGHAVDVFAFPIGKTENMSPAAHRLALQHYSVVLSAAGGGNVGPMSLPAELRRYFHPDSVWELELQLQGILDRPGRPATADAARPSVDAVGSSARAGVHVGGAAE